jgi:hypothetical protein
LQVRVWSTVMFVSEIVYVGRIVDVAVFLSNCCMYRHMVGKTQLHILWSAIQRVPKPVATGVGIVAGCCSSLIP